MKLRPEGCSVLEHFCQLRRWSAQILKARCSVKQSQNHFQILAPKKIEISTNITHNTNSNF